MNLIVETLGALFAIDNNIDFFISHFPQMILIFAVISCGGWIYETIYCSIVDGELSKRGFLFGPSCPIYGIGALAIWIVLGSISNPLIVFVLGGMLATTIEYSTGLFLEHRFKKKWWDYSMFKYNLHGIVCPQASAVFGAFSVMSVFIFIPKMMSILSIFSFHTLSIMAFIVVSLYFIDTLVSILWNGPSTHQKVENAAYNASQKAEAVAHSATKTASKKVDKVSSKIDVATQKIKNQLPESFFKNNK